MDKQDEVRRIDLPLGLLTGIWATLRLLQSKDEDIKKAVTFWAHTTLRDSGDTPEARERLLFMGKLLKMSTDKPLSEWDK
jgi:hypothetical protein